MKVAFILGLLTITSILLFASLPATTQLKSPKRILFNPSNYPQVQTQAFILA